MFQGSGSAVASTCDFHNSQTIIAIRVIPAANEIQISIVVLTKFS
jgi:hypothetical protein